VLICAVGIHLPERVVGALEIDLVVSVI